MQYCNLTVCSCNIKNTPSKYNPPFVRSVINGDILHALYTQFPTSELNLKQKDNLKYLLEMATASPSSLNDVRC